MTHDIFRAREMRCFGTIWIMMEVVIINQDTQLVPFSLVKNGVRQYNNWSDKILRDEILSGKIWDRQRIFGWQNLTVLCFNMSLILFWYVFIVQGIFWISADKIEADKNFGWQNFSTSCECFGTFVRRNFVR